MSVCLSACLSVCLWFFLFSLSHPVCLFLCPPPPPHSPLCLYVSVCQSNYMFVCLSIYLTLCLTVPLSLSRSPCLSVFVSVCLFPISLSSVSVLLFSLSLSRSPCLSVFVSVCLFPISLSSVSVLQFSLSLSPVVCLSLCLSVCLLSLFCHCFPLQPHVRIFPREQASTTLQFNGAGEGGGGGGGGVENSSNGGVVGVEWGGGLAARGLVGFGVYDRNGQVTIIPCCLNPHQPGVLAFTSGTVSALRWILHPE